MTTPPTNPQQPTDQPEKAPSEKTVFLRALEIDAGPDREAYLAEACGEDAALRQRIKRLIGAAESEEDLLDPSRYDPLNEARDTLAEELAEEGRFLGGLVSEDGAERSFGQDYQLQEELGRGAMGVVFRARQLSLGREVAVKIILGSALASPAERERFQVEAEAAAGLKHPNVVPVYEVGRERGHDYYSMALMTGGTLGDRMKRERLAPREAVQLVLVLAQTIHAAHQQGLLHRDLKPDNILLDQTGQPHISDFGLACRLEQRSTLTISGQVMGTPQYMAPEQIDAGGGPATTAIDLYSLGAVLYELLAGVPPIQGDSVLTTLQRVHEEAPKPLRSVATNLDRDLETIVMKCLEKDPSNRYGSANALASDLEAWLKHRPIAAQPPTATQRVRKWVRRRPVHAALVCVSVLLILVLGVGGPIGAWQQAKLRQEADAARTQADALRAVADEQRRAAEAGQAAAVLAKQRSQSLAYALSTRLAAAVSEPDTPSLAPHAILRSFMPTADQPDLRGWEWYHRFAEIYDQPKRFGGWRKSPVQTLCFSPNGSLLLVAHEDRNGSVLHDGLHTAIVRPLNDPSGSHIQAAWHDDGVHLATVSRGGVARIWNTDTGTAIASLPAEPQALSLSWRPAHQGLMVLTADQTIVFWDTQTLAAPVPQQTVQPKLEGLEAGPLTQARMSPDGRYVAAMAQDDQHIYLWETARLDALPRVLDGHQAAVTGLAWQRDSRWLASLSHDQDDVRLWEVPEGTRLVRTYRSTSGEVGAMAWDPNGLRLALGGNDQAVWLFNALEGKLSTVQAYDQAVTALAWDGIKQGMAVGFPDGSVELRRVDTPKSEVVLTEPTPPPNRTRFKDLKWSRNGRLIACLTEQDRLSIVDAQTGEPWLNRFTLDQRPVSALAWNPLGHLGLAVGQTLPPADRLGDETPQAIVRILNPNNRNPGRPPMRLQGGGVRSIAWGPAPETMWVLTADGAVRRCDPYLREQTGVLLEPVATASESNTYQHLALSRDGTKLLATGHPEQVGVCDLATGLWTTFPVPAADAAPRFGAWHPEGGTFATGHADGVIVVWDVTRGQPIQRFSTQNQLAPRLAWHPGGARLVSGGGGRMIHLWDWQTGDSPMSLGGFAGRVTAVGWSPDGSRLAACGQDGQLRVWDATAGYLMNP